MIAGANDKIEILIFDLFLNNWVPLGLNKGICMFDLHDIFLKDTLDLTYWALFVIGALQPILLIIALNEKHDPLAHRINHLLDICVYGPQILRMQIIHP